MARLRQSESLQSGNIPGFASGNYPWMPPPVWWDNPMPIVRGGMQVVLDEYVKSRFDPFWRFRYVKPLNNVAMSKIEFFTPKQPVSIVTRDFSSTISLKGDNPAALAHNATGWWLAPPSVMSYLYLISVDAKVASYLLQRAYSKMSSAEYDFGVSVGEVAETASMLAGPLRGIVKLSGKALAGVSHVYTHGGRVSLRIAKNATSKQIRTLKATTTQHPLKNSLRLVDESANHWLAYKFGVCPLVDDIDKAIQFAKENVSPHFGLRVARVKGWKKDETVLRPNYTMGLCASQLQLAAYGTVRTIDRHTCGLYWRNKVNAPIVNFLENIGLSPFQLPSLAYELVPLSFVVDRFIDIKSFVRGNIGSLTKDTYGNFTTRKVETIWANSFRLKPVSGRTDKVSHDLTSYAHMQQMARTVNIDRPNFPVINPYLTQQLVADATNLSLIWGRLRTFVGKL